MFKIRFARDILADTPEKRNKITGVEIVCGYHCYNWCNCEYGRKCKYRKGRYRLHNLSVKIHRFFEYKLHIKLPYLFSIVQYNTDLSGTTKCPFKEPRHYSCYDCKFCAGIDENIDTICSNKYHLKLMKEGRWKEADIEGKDYCKFFDKASYADNYDKNTGMPIYNDDIKEK